MAQDPRKGLFKFNLLPPKSEKEVELEVERDDSILYSMILVFVGGLIFFGLTIANVLLVEPRVAQFEQAVTERNNLIEQFSSTIATNGELFVKVRTLQPVLEKKIDTSEIFRVANAITSIDPDVNIISYARERSGLFVFSFSSPTLNELGGLIEGIKDIQGTSQLFVRGSRSRDLQQDYLTEIELSIDAA